MIDYLKKHLQYISKKKVKHIDRRYVCFGIIFLPHRLLVNVIIIPSNNTIMLPVPSR